MSHALLLAAVFCGGLLTIPSPCILPVLPCGLSGAFVAATGLLRAPCAGPILGLVVVGVHTPELPRERPRANVVEDAVRRPGVDCPVAPDDDRAVRRAFSNGHWPPRYLADRRGRVGRARGTLGTWGPC